MKKKNKPFVIIIIITFVIVVGLLFFNKYLNKSILIELSVNEVIDKIENKETFVLCISRTNCTHCAKYKPKLEKISKEYDIKIFYINIDEYSDEEENKFKKYVSFDGGTPVTAFIKNGNETTASNRIFGDLSYDKIVKKLKNNGFINE